MNDHRPQRLADLALGHGPIDAMHEEFLECCAALATAGADDFLQTLDALIEHSVRHFEQENTWMRDTGFPPAGCHIKEHAAVLDVLHEAKQHVVAGDHDVGRRLAEELPKWFEHHVATMDGMLADFLMRQPEQVA